MKKSAVDSARDDVRRAQEELTRRTEECSLFETRHDWYTPENARAMAHAWQLKETATRKLLRAWELFDASVDLEKRGAKFRHDPKSGIKAWWAA